MKASAFVGTSVDGFIARSDGALDFLDHGGITMTAFLQARLLDRLIVTRVPVIIGAGIPLLRDTGSDIVLERVATRHYLGGLVQSEYVLAVPPQRVAP